MSPEDAGNNDMIRRVNIIPERLIQRRRVNRTLAVWVVTCVGVAGLIAAGSVAVWVDGRGRHAGINERIAEMVRSAEEAAAALPALEARAADLRRRVVIEERRRNRPDWSALLVLLESARGIDVVLESVELVPAEAGAAPDRVSAIAVNISGVGTDTAGVLAYATRLQDAGVFDALPAPRTGARTAGDRDLIGFQMSGRIGQLPTPSAPRAEASQ